MFYIIDTNAIFQKQAHHGGPQGLHLSCNWENRQYAERFHSEAKAKDMLEYWKYNNDFKGRVIDYQTALEMGDGDY